MKSFKNTWISMLSGFLSKIWRRALKTSTKCPLVYKESSTTTKVRAVFDASAKTSSGTSFNDRLMVGPTVHPQLVDDLLKFRTHRVALTDISKMYRAV